MAVHNRTFPQVRVLQKPRPGLAQAKRVTASHRAKRSISQSGCYALESSGLGSEVVAVRMVAVGLNPSLDIFPTHTLVGQFWLASG